MLYNVWAGGEKLNAHPMNQEQATKMARLWNAQQFGVGLAMRARSRWRNGKTLDNIFAKPIKQWTP